MKNNTIIVKSAVRVWIVAAVLSCFLFSYIRIPVLAVAADAAASGGIGDATIVYGIIALLSFVLFAGCLLLNRYNDRKFILLYGAVFVVNTGYFILSVSSNLAYALLANRISYFGAAYAVLIMLLIILDVCQIRLSRGIVIGLCAVSTAAFLLAASGGITGAYYAQVDMIRSDGVTRLVKVYGPLHGLYSVYLLVYFGLMVLAIVYSIFKKRSASALYAVFLAAIVLGNIGIWLVEQMIRVEFEFLSVSYMVTEVLLLLLYSMLRSYGILDPVQTAVSPEHGELPPNLEELYSSFAERVRGLSAAEMRILKYYIDGYETADIPDLAYISIHTVKKHNRSIYQKLGIASRDELMLYIDLFRRCGRLEELV